MSKKSNHYQKVEKINKISEGQQKLSIINKIQNNWCLLWLTILSRLILPIIWWIIWGKDWIIVWLIISIPLSTMWFLLFLWNMGLSFKYIWEYIANIFRFLLVLAIIVLLSYRTRWMSLENIVIWILGFLWAIKRYIISLVWILLIIYLIVKFIKRSWKH